MADLVIAGDAVVHPMRELPLPIRQSLRAEGDDYVVSRLGSRTASMVVNGAAAALLRCFRQPANIVAAVLAYSRSTGIDPHVVLEQSIPVLNRLVDAGILVAEGSDRAKALGPALAPGDVFAGVEVLRAVQVAADTDVYQALTTDGRMIALKLVRPGAPNTAARELEHEVAILEHLAGAPSPRLVDSGACGGQHYLCTDWCRGERAGTAAAAARSAGGHRAERLLRRIVESILASYADLHARGVLHADVHPGNVLVDGNRITLLDLGLAHRPAAEDAAPARRGVPFYFEPEYAVAWLAGAEPPGPTPAGEQYAVAALLYRLLTGQHYRDFALDMGMLRQIAEEPPLPFAARGLQAWTEGEAVLRRALSKDPARRYESLAACAEAFRQAVRSSEPRRSLTCDRGRPAWRRTQPVLDRLEADPHTMLAPPTASLYYGAAGISYALYRLAGLNEDAALLTSADVWAERAVRESRHPEGLHSVELTSTNGGTGPVSIYHTVTGVHLVRAIVSAVQGDRETADDAASRFCAVGTADYDNLDATLGQTSVLTACSQLVRVLPAGPGAEAAHVLGTQLLRSVWERLDGFGDLAGTDALRWLGVAHGWAGVLYATLQWMRASGAAEPARLRSRLDELADLAEVWGAGLRWPQRSGTPTMDRSPATGWCHGSAGYVHLWILADRMVGHGRHLDLAERAARHAWLGPSRTGSSLCCGLAGRAYALLALYRRTGEAAWLDRGIRLVDRATETAGRAGRRNSLYAGDLGIALLAAEATSPEFARMPLFELDD